MEFRDQIVGWKIRRLQEAANWLETATPEDLPPPLATGKERLEEMRRAIDAELLRRVQDHLMDWTLKNYPDIILSEMDLED